MFNKIVLVGNLTRDIEIRYLNNGVAIGNTAIAVNRKFNVDGETREETLFVDLTFFGKQAEIANQYLRKGSKVLIEGRLALSSWHDTNSGQNRHKHYVVVISMEMLGGANNNTDDQKDTQVQEQNAQQQEQMLPNEAYISNDDMPF